MFRLLLSTVVSEFWTKDPNKARTFEHIWLTYGSLLTIRECPSVCCNFYICYVYYLKGS